MSRGNDVFLVKGAEAAARRRIDTDAQIDVAKEAIETEIRRGSYKGGPVTMRSVLARTTLKPNFRFKENRLDAAEALQLWIEQRNKEIRQAPKAKQKRSDDRQSLLDLTRDFTKLQNAYYRDCLTDNDRDKRLKNAATEIAVLKAKNARLTDRLKAAGLPIDG